MDTVHLVSCRDQSDFQLVLTEQFKQHVCSEGGQTQSPELVPGSLGVGVSVMEGVGNKQNPLHISATHTHTHTVITLFQSSGEPTCCDASNLLSCGL